MLIVADCRLEAKLEIKLMFSIGITAVDVVLQLDFLITALHLRHGTTYPKQKLAIGLVGAKNNRN